MNSSGTERRNAGRCFATEPQSRPNKLIYPLAFIRREQRRCAYRHSAQVPHRKKIGEESKWLRRHKDEPVAGGDMRVPERFFALSGRRKRERARKGRAFSGVANLARGWKCAENNFRLRRQLVSVLGLRAVSRAAKH